MDPKTEDWAAKIAEAVKKGVAEALNSAGLSAPGTSKVGGAEPSTPSTMGPSPATRHPRGQMLRSVPYNKDDTKSKFPEGKKQDIMPISDLRPGMTGFTLQGRVISKSPVAFYRGKVGRLFSVEIIDVKGFVTRLTFYDKVADKCIILLDVSGVYTFKGGKTTKPSKKYNPNAIVEVKFINENAQDIEIKQMDDDRSIPSSPTHQFRSIQDARKMTAGSLVDVCGILLECSELETVHISKTNEKKQKRNFTIIDYSDVVQETAWDERAADCIVTPDITEKNAVITLKQARVVEFNEQTLTVGPHTLIQARVQGHLTSDYSPGQPKYPRGREDATVVVPAT
ncbi:60S acidic ribosomal protein P1 [Perkinsus chesapeaki]|uniref:60S acidic ribosomal protein P1 n=1 Tax=Perkinsus chesapeaki TaxID=330153 RepID=A0A7J6LXZ3_PERCH|nr:60S acidic ribosomal protein P1 [Perkinsus chesapeaki]